ncbi:MAG: N-acetylmuramoyl-L-alanine amidase [Holophagales bacterium]|jgi:hypothetical protein|nr:N-acetylmuramoyl-L-alanine amidase [Holophagales bacterium]
MRHDRPSSPALVGFVLGLLATSTAAAEVRSVSLVLESADVAEAGLTSTVLDPHLTFSAIGSHWRDVPGARLELSVSADGIRWGRWIAVPPDGEVEPTREDGEPNPFGGETLGALVFVDPASRYLRGRLLRPAGAPGTDEPPRISLHVIDPGSADSRSAARGATLPRRAAAPPPEIPDAVPGAARPRIFGRAEWGARPPRTAYTTTLAGHVGIHHTATVEDFAANAWEECAARVRAIQTYHIDTQGWNDIGYAYVVCRHGDVFQAREDDDDSTDVQGAHDGFNRGSTGISAFGYFHPPVNHQPSQAQLAALVHLTSWIASRRGIDPLGKSLYAAFGAPVDNVYGHRDVGATACPGDGLYALMEAIRNAVGDQVLRQLY